MLLTRTPTAANRGGDERHADDAALAAVAIWDLALVRWTGTTTPRAVLATGSS
jgi:hypothetical protein